MATQVIASVSGNQECVADIAESMVLPYLLFALEHVPAGWFWEDEAFVMLQLIHFHLFHATQGGKRPWRACTPWCLTRRLSSRPSRVVCSCYSGGFFATDFRPDVLTPYLPS